MLTSVPKVTDEHLNAHMRAVQYVLNNFPCCDCGQKYPCPCDEKEQAFELGIEKFAENRECQQAYEKS